VSPHVPRGKERMKFDVTQTGASATLKIKEKKLDAAIASELKG